MKGDVGPHETALSFALPRRRPAIFREASLFQGVLDARLSEATACGIRARGNRPGRVRRPGPGWVAGRQAGAVSARGSDQLRSHHARIPGGRWRYARMYNVPTRQALHSSQQACLPQIRHPVHRAGAPLPLRLLRRRQPRSRIPRASMPCRTVLLLRPVPPPKRPNAGAARTTSRTTRPPPSEPRRANLRRRRNSRPRMTKWPRCAGRWHVCGRRPPRRRSAARIPPRPTAPRRSPAWRASWAD